MNLGEAKKLIRERMEEHAAHEAIGSSDRYEGSYQVGAADALTWALEILERIPVDIEGDHGTVYTIGEELEKCEPIDPVKALRATKAAWLRQVSQDPIISEDSREFLLWAADKIDEGWPIYTPSPEDIEGFREMFGDERAKP